MNEDVKPSQISGLSSAELRERVLASEPDTFKVYVKEWVHRFTGTYEACKAELVKRYEGRVEQTDWSIAAVATGRYNLTLRLWNVDSEWKDRARAMERATGGRAVELHPDVRVVQRNSREEVELRDYSVKKIVK